MTDFMTDGFLGDEISRYESQIADRYSDELDLAKNVNRIAHEIIWSIEIELDESSMLLTTTWIRQVETFQAFLIIIGKGLFPQSEILLRSIAESMFIVGAIGKDQTFAKNYLLSDHASRLKIARMISEYQRRRGITPDARLKTLIRELEEGTQKINEETGQRKSRPFRTEEIAKIAQLMDYYDTLYRLTSMAVHTLPRSLNGMFVVGTGDDIEAVKYEPKVDGLETYLASATAMALHTLDEIANHFSLDSTRTRIEEMRRRLESLLPTSDKPLYVNFRRR